MSPSETHPRSRLNTVPKIICRYCWDWFLRLCLPEGLFPAWYSGSKNFHVVSGRAESKQDRPIKQNTADIRPNLLSPFLCNKHRQSMFSKFRALIMFSTRFMFPFHLVLNRSSPFCVSGKEHKDSGAICIFLCGGKRPALQQTEAYTQWEPLHTGEHPPIPTSRHTDRNRQRQIIFLSLKNRD